MLSRLSQDRMTKGTFLLTFAAFLMKTIGIIIIGSSSRRRLQTC